MVIAYAEFLNKTNMLKSYTVNLKICGRRLHQEQADSFLLDPRFCIRDKKHVEEF